MRSAIKLTFCCICLIFAWVSSHAQKVISSDAAPRVFLLDAKHLQAIKQRLRANDPQLAPAWAKLEQEAKKALTSETFSVVNKEVFPPSGDKRDYMSQAPYWWPDPKSPSGLPYIRRDGERNPEINKISDHRTMDQMVAAVETLALAYYFKGDEAYATKAAQLLRAWFLDAATRMNPNLKFAQGIPGINTGRGIGLIETRGLTRAVDAVGLLAESKAWSEADQRGVQAWFGSFLKWMLESKNGREEAAAKNNHGTYYDLQAVSFALFLGKRDLPSRILQTARQKRIALQIEPDGRQPLELARTRAWSYSVGNLDGLMLLARLGENVGVDLWNYQTKDGRGIRRALDYLVPFALGEQKWPYQQLGEWPPQMLYSLLRRAARFYQEPKYLTNIPNVEATDRSHLLFPQNAAPKSAQANPNANRATWLQQARWGVMTHYLPDWIEPERKWTSADWNKLVDGFDVEGIAQQLASVGASYYLISIGQNSGFYLAPNPTYDQLTGIQPSKCSRRDLVADLYEALNKRGIRLMVYLPSGAPNKDQAAVRALGWQNGPYPNREFSAKWEQIVRAWSLRWGSKVSGWWFDGCYWPNTMYRSPTPPNFESFAAAARTGNPASILAFNPGVVYRTLSITPHEDYIAGEIDHPDRQSIRRVVDGNVDGAQLHMLSYLGQTWGKGAPRFTNEQVITATQNVVRQRGAVTWDVPAQTNGLIAAPFLEQLKALQRALNSATQTRQ